MMYYTFFASPLGRILLVADGKALTGVHFVGSKHYPASGLDWREGDSAEPFPAARHQLAEYFAGQRQHFDLPLAPSGTPLQQRIWQTIAGIAYGTTLTYGELASRVGKPRAARAAGAATGRNPLSILIPCHRVIGADGALTGYAGGIERKRALLALEATARASGARPGPLGTAQDPLATNAV